MTNSQAVISVLADRITSAYERMQPRVGCEIATKKASMAAAALLLQAHLDDEDVPLDPELYVASQSKRARELSPWFDLATPAALRCYVKRVRKMSRSLHDELVWEIERAEKKMADGESVFKVLMKADPKVSGLSRYILAHRFHRPALANRFLAEALAQHRACPLYRQATIGILDSQLYPNEARLQRSLINDRTRPLPTEKEDAGLNSWN